MSRLTKFQLNQLATFIYLKFDYVNESLGSLIEKLLLDDCQLMDKNLLDNRLYSDNILDNIYNALDKVNYPTFKNGYDIECKELWKDFLINISEDKVLCSYEIIHLTDRSETFEDEFLDYNKKNSGYKAMGLYNKNNNDLIYVIRGTNGDLQWLDNCKAISEYLTAVEKESVKDYRVCYKKVEAYKPKITFTGHSKGGLTSMILGKIIKDDVKISTLYAPFINKRLLENLLKVPSGKLWESKDKLDSYMDLFYPIEIHIADIVGGLFLDQDILNNYFDKFVFVGEFDLNGWDFLKNHEPIPQVNKKNYDINGNPIKSKDPIDFIIFILSINKEVLVHSDKIVYPLLISIFKEIKLLGNNSPKGFYDNNILLRESYCKQFCDNADLMEFSFDTMKNNVIQWRGTCQLIYDIFTNREIFICLFDLFEDDEKCILNSNICISKKNIIMKFIQGIIEHCDKDNFAKDKMIIIGLLVDILGAIF